MHPASIGSFQILRELGRGGMGEVYLARDTRLDRQVAIKALPAHLATDPDRLARFQREAKVLASLNHPGIGAIYGLEEAAGHQYLILEFVEGETLADRLSRGAIPVDEVLSLARQIAEALEVAHEKGVVHRDLKPGNVMVTPDSKVKVLDFGLARTEEGTPSSSGAMHLSDSPTLTTPVRVHSPTIPGAIMGSAGYMSPEQARGRPVDKRSDIFSFGCVLYEMLTGLGPFRGETVTDSLGAILHREPEWSHVPQGTPNSVLRLMKRCLAKDKHNRLHDIADARLELDSIAADHSQWHDQAVAPGGSPDIRRLRQREIFAWALASVALVLAVGSAAFLWVRGIKQEIPAPSGFRQVNVQREAVFRSRFAPDGKSVLYSAAREGNTPDIYVARPGAAVPESLAMRGTHLLAVSSQGELAVLTKAKYHFHSVFVGTLARMPMAGGAPRQLLENVHDADWAPDGTQLAIIRGVGGKDRIEFPIGKVLCETSGMFSDLRFSPKGDRLAYFEHPNWGDDRGTVNIVDLSGKTKAITPDYASLEGIAWSRDGREVLYSATLNSGYVIFAASENGAPRIVEQAPGGLLIQDIGHDGQRLVNQDAWGFGIVLHTAGEAKDKDLSWLGFSNGGYLSPDGKMFVFDEESETMGSTYSVCIRGTDGSPVVRLGEGVSQGLSRDTKWALGIVYSSPQRLVAYPTGPGDPVIFDRGNIEAYVYSEWFPDGKRVLFCGSEPGKGVRFYVQDFKGGAPRAVTPEVSPDSGIGKLSADGLSVLTRDTQGAPVIYPLDGGPPRPVKGLQPDDQVIRWNEDGSVFAIRSFEVPCKVERVNLEDGKRELFLTLTPGNLAGVTSLAPRSFSDDLKMCLYDYTQSVSRLYVTGERR